MSCGMKGESLGNSGGFGPWFDKLVDTRRQIEHMVVCCLVPTFGIHFNASLEAEGKSVLSSSAWLLPSGIGRCQ